MNNNSGDRRARRTRRLLREALFALILENGYDAVTIEDITEHADLGRTTFYLHYKDKEDLLIQCIQEVANELASQIDLVIPSSNYPGGLVESNPILFVFQHASQNAILYRIILRGEGSSYKASSRLREIISHYAYEFLDERRNRFHITNAVPLEVIANYFSGSLLGMLTWWLENNMPYPVQEISEMFRRLFFTGLRDLQTNE
jgi:AcrR family transcriptional regulator